MAKDGKTTNPQGATIAIIAIAAAAIAIMACIVAVALGRFDASTEDEGTATYRTHLYGQMGLRGPAFAFDYPGNWTVTEAECDPGHFSEFVTLTSDSGRTIDFRFGNACVSTSFVGPSEKVASTDFDPEPYPGLGKPATVRDYEWRDLSDEEIQNLSFEVSSVSRPEQLGRGFGYSVSGWYYGYFQFMSLGFASQGNDVFAEDETREVVQILSSLRQEQAK